MTMFCLEVWKKTYYVVRRRRERLYDYIPFIQGMEIRDEVQRHILKLFEVPLNIPTTIRCSSWDDLYHQDISFKVKGDEGKT